MIANSALIMSPKDVHVLRSIISVRGAVPEGERASRQALAELLQELQPTSDSELIANAIGLHDEVNIRILSDSQPEESTLQIVMPAMSDPAKGKISIFAPMSIGLLGRSCGETVTIETPHGTLVAEIISVTKAEAGD